MTTVQTEPTAEDRADQARDAYTAGLRALADLLDQHPQIPTPDTGGGGVSGGPLYIFGSGGTPEVAENLLKLLGRPAVTEMAETRLWLTWRIEGVALKIAAGTADLCERVVTGTVRVGAEVREVVELSVPDRFLPAPAEAVSA